MERFFKNLIVQAKDFYKNLSPTKRISLILAGATVVVSVGVTTLMLSGAEYVPLFTNVAPDQMTLLVEKLKSKNTPFRISKDGSAILVPSEMLHATQMGIMSEAGSDKMGSIGFEIFEKQDFGTTSYAQRINFQRALQGELMRAINTLDSVKKSKVILALPPKKTFLEEGGKATASVVVELNPGKVLSEDQVRGITYLVSNAVEGLQPEDVTVVDARGKILSKSFDAASAASGHLMEMQQKLERQLEDRIESMLSRVVGQGRVIAKVNASLNAKHTTTLEETFDPDKTAIRSQLSEDEKLDGKRTNPVGVPGARANVPGAEDAGSVGFNQNVAKEIKTTNYEVPKTTRNIKESAGAVERLTVAVLVDGATDITQNKDGEEERVWKPRTAEEMAKYESIVRNAIGFNDKRGDSVKLENIEFKPEDFTESEKLLTSLERKKLIHALIKWGLLLCSLLAFFFLVIRPFMRWITDSVHESVEDMLPKTIEELEELQSVDNTLPGMSGALPVLEESLDPNKAESELLRERIMALVQQDEEKATGAFSLWLVRKDL